MGKCNVLYEFQKNDFLTNYNMPFTRGDFHKNILQLRIKLFQRDVQKVQKLNLFISIYSALLTLVWINTPTQYLFRLFILNYTYLLSSSLCCSHFVDYWTRKSPCKRQQIKVTYGKNSPTHILFNQNKLLKKYFNFRKILIHRRL